MRSSVLIPPSPSLSAQCMRTMPPQSPFSRNPSHCSARPYHQTAIHLWGICCTEMSLYVGPFFCCSRICPPIFHRFTQKLELKKIYSTRLHIYFTAEHICGLISNKMCPNDYFKIGFCKRRGC